MGPIILVFIVVLLIIALAMPALRTRFGRDLPPPDGDQPKPHEEVVKRLDDHRKK